MPIDGMSIKSPRGQGKRCRLETRRLEVPVGVVMAGHAAGWLYLIWLIGYADALEGAGVLFLTLMVSLATVVWALVADRQTEPVSGRDHHVRRWFQ